MHTSKKTSGNRLKNALLKKQKKAQNLAELGCEDIRIINYANFPISILI